MFLYINKALERNEEEQKEKPRFHHELGSCGRGANLILQDKKGMLVIRLLS